MWFGGVALCEYTDFGWFLCLIAFDGVIPFLDDDQDPQGDLDGNQHECWHKCFEITAILIQDPAQCRSSQ